MNHRPYNHAHLDICGIWVPRGKPVPRGIDERPDSLHVYVKDIAGIPDRRLYRPLPVFRFSEVFVAQFFGPLICAFSILPQRDISTSTLMNEYRRRARQHIVRVDTRHGEVADPTGLGPGAGADDLAQVTVGGAELISLGVHPLATVATQNGWPSVALSVPVAFPAAPSVSMVTSTRCFCPSPDDDGGDRSRLGPAGHPVGPPVGPAAPAAAPTRATGPPPPCTCHTTDPRAR